MIKRCCFNSFAPTSLYKRSVVVAFIQYNLSTCINLNLLIVFIQILLGINMEQLVIIKIVTIYCNRYAPYAASKKEWDLSQSDKQNFRR